MRPPIRRPSASLLSIALLWIPLASGCAAPREGAAPADEVTSGTLVPISTASQTAREAFLRGRDLRDRQRRAEARAAFEAAVAADPDFALGYLLLAQSENTGTGYFGNLKRAVELADKASESERLMILAVQAGAAGDPTTQLRHLEKLVERHPKDPRVHDLLGTFFFGQQQYERAIAELERATALDPRLSGPYNLLGYANRFLGRFDAAEAAFRAYIALLPDDPNPYDSYAELLLETGRFEASIEQYEKALAIDPRFGSSYRGIASALTYLGRHSEARARLDDATAHATDDGELREARFSAAATFADEGRYEEASAELEKARAIAAATSDFAEMANDDGYLGRLRLEMGDAVSAQRFFDRARSTMEASGLDPAIVANAVRDHLAGSARTDVVAGDLEAAKAKAARYQREAEEGENRLEIFTAHRLNGLIALAEERWQDAMAELEQTNPRSSYDLFLRARALEGAGRAQEAAALYAEVAGFNPILTLEHAYVRTAAAKKAAGG